MSNENFPTRPENGAAYGFWTTDRFDRPRVVVESTEKLLKETLRREPARIEIVWTPDHPHGVPPQEVDFLKDEALFAAKEGLHRQQKSQILQLSLALLGLVVASFLGYGGNWLVWLLVAIVGLSPALDLIQKLRNKQKSDAQSLNEWAVQTRFATWLRLRPSYWSGILVGLFAFVMGLPFLLHLFIPIELGTIGPLVAAGLVKDLVRAGEYWRLLSAGYLHLSFAHIWFNGLALWYLGRRLEEITHPLVLPVVFVLGVIGGSLMSLWLDPRLSVGASGGILAVDRRHRRDWISLHR
jgi:hypothetical protein